jgi:hypothetical protein
VSVTGTVCSFEQGGEGGGRDDVVTSRLGGPKVPAADQVADRLQAKPQAIRYLLYGQVVHLGPLGNEV